MKRIAVIAVAVAGLAQLVGAAEKQEAPNAEAVTKSLQSLLPLHAKIAALIKDPTGITPEQAAEISQGCEAQLAKALGDNKYKELSKTAAENLPNIVAELRASLQADQSKNSLRIVGGSLHLYADDHDGAFPPKLSALAPQYIQPTALLRGNLETHGSDGVDYVYVQGLTSSDSGAYIIACETVPGRDEKVAVLNIMKEVIRMTPQEAEKALEKQIEEVKTKYKRNLVIQAPKRASETKSGKKPELTIPSPPAVPKVPKTAE